MDFLSDIVKLIIGGIITYLFQKKKDRKRDKKEEIAKLEERHKNRPEFVITEMKDFVNYSDTDCNAKTSDIEVFVAHIKKISVIRNDVVVKYEDTILDKKLWAFRQYTLKNVGNSAVYGVQIISNFKKDTCIFNPNMINERNIKEGWLNYSQLLDKRIAPNESFTLKLYYNKILVNPMIASLTVGMRDNTNTYWVQPFFAPEDKLYESTKISYKEYREELL